MSLSCGVRETTRKTDEKETPGRSANSACLEYYIHDEIDSLRFEIIGDLTGPRVASLGNAWRTANSVLSGRQIVVGLTAVAAADDDGRAVLLNWHRSGARFVARSADSQALAESVLGERVATLETKPGWRRRFRHFVELVAGSMHALSTEP